MTRFARPRKMPQSINRNFAQSPLFRKACELAKTEPTKRQASKFRNKKGLAYWFVKQARKLLRHEQIHSAFLSYSSH